MELHTVKPFMSHGGLAFILSSHALHGSSTARGNECLLHASRPLADAFKQLEPSLVSVV